MMQGQGKNRQFQLRVLQGTDLEAERYTTALNAGWTTRHLWTGSVPMRPIDVQGVWKREREAGSIEWGIWIGEDFVGTTGLYSKREIYRSWEFRIILHDPGAVGEGIGRGAAVLVVNWAFQRLNAHRVWLSVNAENKQALSCYEGVGFKHEGRLREEIFCFGKYCDAVRMGILEDEWKSLRPPELNPEGVAFGLPAADSR